MGSIHDGHITQTGDRLTANEVQEFRDTARRAQRTASVDGMTFETMHGGTHVRLDDTIRNPDHINDWFLGMIVPRPEPPEGQMPEFPELHGAMYYVAEVVDDSVDTDHIAVTELQAQLTQWLLGFSDVIPPGQTESPRDRQRKLTGARFVVATNLAELSVHSHMSDAQGNPAPEPDGAGLPDGTIVKVFMGRSLDGRPRYYFSSGAASLIQQFRIIVVKQLDLLCRKWDGETAGDRALVWKPWTLRVSPDPYTDSDGVTYRGDGPQSRTVSIPGAFEEQVTIPRYQGEPNGDILYATFGPTGGIASHHPADDYANVTGTSRWLDLNLDGRQWARKVGT